MLLDCCKLKPPSGGQAVGSLRIKSHLYVAISPTSLSDLLDHHLVIFEKGQDCLATTNVPLAWLPVFHSHTPLPLRDRQLPERLRWSTAGRGRARPLRLPGPRAVWRLSLDVRGAVLSSRPLLRVGEGGLLGLLGLQLPLPCLLLLSQVSLDAQLLETLPSRLLLCRTCSHR